MLAERRQRFVHIERHALREIRTKINAAGGESLQAWIFGRLAHDSAGRTSSKHHGRRSLQHGHALQVERIAVVTAEITHAIEENIVARSEAANG